MKTPQERRDLEEGLLAEWTLPGELFGNVGCNIYDFEVYNYTHFLDNVRTREGLVQGLRELSPFANDALEVAERMSDSDFYAFKLALASERGVQERGECESTFPAKYDPVLLPRRLLEAVHLAEQFEAPLGSTLFRLMDLEEEVE